MLTFNMPVPKSWSKKAKRQALWYSHSVRPDLDNLVKAVMDGLEGVVYDADSRVASLQARKFYGDEPGVEVYVSNVEAKA